MLLKFTVKNYLSFKDETSIELIPNKDKSHEECLIKDGENTSLPTIAIYGPNGAGKSNLNKAFTAAIILIRASNSFQIGQQLPFITPFLLDNTSKNEKTCFDFVFTQHGKKYNYGFALDRTQIYEEYLYEYNSSRASMIFNRCNINQYYFTTSTSKELSPMVEKNTPNKLFLSTATCWNSKFTKDAFEWFNNMIDTYDSQNLENQLFQELDNEKTSNSNSLKNFALKMFKMADINISDFTYDIIQKTAKYGFAGGDDFYTERIIRTAHQIETDNKKETFYLNITDESNGTKRLFTYVPLLKKALENGRTVIFDEMDNCLHPELMKTLVKMFQDPRINKSGAQLIFNSHETALLDLDLLRRDQIIFAEKNPNTGVSHFTSLSNYSPRKDENVRKGYFEGKYSSIPNINLDDMF